MKDEYLKRWLVKARRDLKVAEHEIGFDAQEIITDAVCFHCQQAVEKFLKAYLISRNVEFPRTHNLELLRELCTRQDREFAGLDLGGLTYYAVEARYPDDFFIPTADEAAKSLKIARAAKKLVSVKLSDAAKKRNHRRKK